ncbi:helix-turn-helix domain-containing protein [Microbacterium sp. SORGH_AS_0888]|uniref:helix-turn-helix domain-containing protein n=1 Tax=Microbacterium sp. SORGH_AS_0888 TaxID=3041791 RepID=UPI0027D8B6EF|nr:helix-turn-helix domain-containing protein [Microbacterium sp. SORGH_AS_0888]
MTDTLTTRPRFYFVDEAAAELRRSPASLRWMLHTGQIKSGKIGGRTVIAASEIERIISEAFAD